MENSYRFFANRDCQYYPCHSGIEEMNCLFCYCPFYLASKCPGKPEYLKLKEGGVVKDCTNCTFPHEKESYDIIIKWLSKQSVKKEESSSKNDRFKK